MTIHIFVTASYRGFVCLHSNRDVVIIRRYFFLAFVVCRKNSYTSCCQNELLKSSIINKNKLVIKVYLIKQDYFIGTKLSDKISR